MKPNLLLFGTLLCVAGSISAAEDIVVTPAAGTDIAAAIETASTGKEVGGITINLADSASYTLSASIVAPGSLAINGNGSTIDAEGLAAPMILMAETPAVELVNNFYRVDSVTVSNLTVNNLKNSIFYDNEKPYCVVNMAFDAVNFNLPTTAVQNEALVSFKGGGAKDFTIKNSTVYGNGEIAKYFIRYSSNARLDRYGYDKDTEFQTMTYLNNTFYNLLKSDGQWGNYNGIQRQKYSKFNIENNIWVNCSENIIRRLVGGTLNPDSPVEFNYNTYYNNGANLASSEASYDNSGTILTTNPSFVNAAAADFTVGAATQQAQYKTGAPKWVAEFSGTLPTTDITVNIAAGDEIAAKIKAAVAEKENAGTLVGSTTVVIAENAEVTLASSIVVPGALAIQGNGAKVNAAALNAPMILMSALPSAPEVNSYYRVDSVTVTNLTVDSMKNSIFYDNNVKYCVVNMAFDTVNFNLPTSDVENEALISFKAGGAKDFTVKNSTIYGNGEVAKYFIRYNNSARLDRYGYDKETELMVNTYNNNTFYNLLKEDGQWGNYSAIAGQNYVKFDVQKNIWVDCGKDIIRRMAGGRFGGNAPLTFAYNTYFENGENLAEAEAAYDKSETILTTNPEFADAAAGNFTIGASTQQAEFQTGAPKWLVPFVSGLDMLEFDENAPVEYFNLQGIRVENPAAGIYIRRQGNKVTKVMIK
ncbi:MAG: DUF5123 domain-containing protein [Duncaniella sp.]|nr:DUF5123 domain-containing protein [Duncaniella sp.]